jgi:hypothetical protein
MAGYLNITNKTDVTASVDRCRIGGHMSTSIMARYRSFAPPVRYVFLCYRNGPFVSSGPFERTCRRRPIATRPHAEPVGSGRALRRKRGSRGERSRDGSLMPRSGANPRRCARAHGCVRGRHFRAARAEPRSRSNSRRSAAGFARVRRQARCGAVAGTGTAAMDRRQARQRGGG